MSVSSVSPTAPRVAGLMWRITSSVVCHPAKKPYWLSMRMSMMSMQGTPARFTGRWSSLMPPPGWLMNRLE